MARAGVSYYDVATAAAALTNTGTAVTVDTVRTAMGNTGSKSTIGPLLKRWKAHQQEKCADIDTGLPRDIVQALRSLYEQMEADAASKIAEHEATYRDANMALVARLEALQMEHLALRSRYDEQQRCLVATQTDLAQWQTDHQRQEIELGRLGAENAALQERLGERTSDIKALHHQLSQSRDQFEHFQKAAAQQRVEEIRLAEQQSARQNQDMVTLRHLLSEAQTALAGERVDSQYLRTSLTKSETATAESTQQLKALQTQLQLQTHELGDLRLQFAHLIERENKTQAALIIAQTELALRNHETSQLTVRLEQSIRQADTLTHQYQSILLEKGALQGQLKQLHKITVEQSVHSKM